MLVVFATLKVKGGQPGRLKASRALNVLAQATREQEEKCRLYSPNMSTEDFSTLTVTEVWDDEEALGAHFQSPHFQEFLQQVSPDLDGDPVITKFEARGLAPTS